MFVLGARAAAVFMIVTSTIALRTATFPRWLIIAGYVIALVMLLSVSLLQWIVLLFPAWVFVMSVYILNSEIRAARAARAADHLTDPEALLAFVPRSFGRSPVARLRGRLVDVRHGLVRFGIREVDPRGLDDGPGARRGLGRRRLC